MGIYALLQENGGGGDRDGGVGSGGGGACINVVHQGAST